MNFSKSRVLYKSSLITYFLVQLMISPLFAQRDTITNYYETERIKLPKGLRAETGGMDFMPDGRLVAVSCKVAICN